MPESEPTTTIRAEADHIYEPDGHRGDRIDETATRSNSLWLLAAQASGIVASGGVSLLAIRRLSVLAWGRYSSAMALIAIATVFSNSGVGALALRKMSAKLHLQEIVLGTSFGAVGAVAVVVSLLLVPIAIGLGYGSVGVELVAIAIPLCFLQPCLGLVQAAFNVRRSLHLAARFQLAQYGLYCGVAVALLLAGAGARGLIFASVASAAVALLLGLQLLVRHHAIRPRLVGARTAIGPYLRLAVPTAGIGIATIVYDRLDVLMLTTLRGPSAVARYTVPYNLMALTMVVPSVVTMAYYPVLSRALAGRTNAPPQDFLRLVRWLLFASVPLALVLGLGGSDLLTPIFGERYARSGAVLAVIAAAPVITFQIYAFWYVILGSHREGRVFWIRVAGLVLNLVANLVLIPLWGAVGAAASWLLAESFTAGAQALVVHRLVFPLPFAPLLRPPAIAAVVVAVPTTLVAVFTYPIVGGAVGALTWVVALGLFGYVRFDELAPAWRGRR